MRCRRTGGSRIPNTEAIDIHGVMERSNLQRMVTIYGR